MKIIIVDDSKNFLNGLRKFITSVLAHKIIAEAENGEDFLKLKNINNADIVLMDIMMPVKDGFAATKEILKSNSKIKIIALTMHTEKLYLEELIKTGFAGCVHKENIFDELEKAINIVAKNKLYFPDTIIIKN